MQNPFLSRLRASYDGIYRRAAERGEATALLVPCAECLEGESFGQVFVEAHMLQASRVPGCFMNLLGQGVEIKDSSVSTHLGFAENRVCEVLQSETMRDYGNTFRVLIIDKPLVGKYRAMPGAADRAQRISSAGAAPVAGLPLPATHGDEIGDYLNSAPAISADFFDKVERFRKTFVQVPGCEQSTAERIREMVREITRRLFKHHKLTQPVQQRQLDYHVSKTAYAALHSFVFPHLVQILSDPEERLERAVLSYTSVGELLEAIPGAQGRGLGLVDVRGCSEQLSRMHHSITPHEKIQIIDDAHSVLQRCVAEGSRIMEITGDDVLSLFILAIYGSDLKQRLAHVAHVEMYLQGDEVARFDEAGYAASALQAALQFFLEEKRPAVSVRGATRATTDIFSRKIGRAHV